MIFAHMETDRVYARVDGFDQDQHAILFSAWDAKWPGWQGGASLETSIFAQLYPDGPYTQELVDQATTTWDGIRAEHKAKPGQS